MIYYAHSIWKYDTEVEKYELGLIRKMFPNSQIINPNGDISHDSFDETDIMRDCLDVVSKCDSLVFSSVNGVIGKGVYDEIQQAIVEKKLVYYLNEHDLKLIAPHDITFIETGEENRRIYAIVRRISL